MRDRPPSFDTGTHKAFFDYYAEASASPATLQRFTGLRDRLLSEIGREPEKLDILDVGCGAGTFSILCADLGHRVTGIDINHQLVQLARDRTHGTGHVVEFHVASATGLPFADRSFDIVCCPELLEHVEDWQRCLDEFTRVLRPNGLLYLSTTNRLCPKQQEFNLPFYSWYPRFVQRRYVKLAMTTRPEIANYAKYPAFHWFTYYSLRAALRKRGYERFVDRFDLMAHRHRTGLKGRIVACVRTVPGLRLLGQIASEGSVIAATKGESLSRRSLRQRWWDLQRSAARWAALTRPANRVFAGVVLRDRLRHATGAMPIRGQTRERARAAAAWLARAQDATPDDGVSYGYFPCDVAGGWDVSYPETTGYIIPSLIAFAKHDNDPSLIARALRMARWETSIQMPSGAVQGGKLMPPEKQTAATFNTGMVLHGFSAAFRESFDPAIFAAGRRAADFLVNDMTPEGYFRTNGEFVAPGRIKVYSALCGWALYLFGQDAKEERYIAAAIRAAEGAMKKQRENGWIADNCLTDPNAPLTHTIGYTLQALIEIGVLAKRPEFIEAALKGVEPLVARLSPTGRLAGRYRADWTPAVGSTCLTGSAQIAIVLYRLTNELGDQRWAAVADRIVDWLKASQVVDCADPGVNGALAGSLPIFGEYMTGGYPNWATKYFLDALMLQEKHSQS